MSKRIQTPEQPETVTIPKSSFDNMFRMMEKMQDEISELKAMVAAKPKETRILTTNEAAEYCGVTRQTISDWVRKKRIHKVMAGCKFGFTMEELNTVREIKK